LPALWKGEEHEEKRIMTQWMQMARSTPGLLGIAALGVAIAAYVWPSSLRQFEQLEQWNRTELRCAPMLEEMKRFETSARQIEAAVREMDAVPPNDLVTSLPIEPDQKRLQHLMTPEQILPGLGSERYRLHATGLTRDRLIEVIHRIDSHAPQWKVIAMSIRGGNGNGEGTVDADLTLQQLNAF
jgi:hypothetical protein